MWCVGQLHCIMILWFFFLMLVPVPGWSTGHLFCVVIIRKKFGLPDLWFGCENRK